MRRRQGFTIIELLVSMALILFVMVILTEAFSAGLETFRQLKALGDMQEHMRSVTIVLRNDLRYDHFDEVRGNRLSDQDLRTQPPPNNGYFRIWQGTPQGSVPASFVPYFQGSTGEGGDGDQLPVARATQSWMAFTVHLHFPGQDHYLFGSLPQPGSSGYDANANTALQGNAPPEVQQGQQNVMYSQWAEVAYFLRALMLSDGVTPVTANGTPLYALYRRQRLLARSNSATLQQPSSWPYYYNVSFPQPTAGAVQVNTPQSITVPTARFGMDPSVAAGIPTVTPLPAPATGDGWRLQDLLGGTTASQSADDLILNNVISFDVKVLAEGGTYGGPPSPFPQNAYDGGLPPGFVDLPASALNRNPTFNQNQVSVFDTWTTQGPTTYGAHWNDNPGNPKDPNQVYLLPLKMRILALQITIRVWDDRTQQARQIAVIQDM